MINKTNFVVLLKQQRTKLMTNIDVLKLLNMYTEAAQIAKAKNKYECHFDIDETTLVELLQKAFPSIVDKANLKNLAKSILQDSI